MYKVSKSLAQRGSVTTEFKMSFCMLIWTGVPILFYFIGGGTHFRNEERKEEVTSLDSMARTWPK